MAMHHLEGALRLEYEVNATYNFGEQNHWELNVAPIALRWQRFPWSELVHTTAAFGKMTRSGCCCSGSSSSPPDRPTGAGPRYCGFTTVRRAGESWACRTAA
jgi:hypothetical protein